jgi:hypothetical protein
VDLDNYSTRVFNSDYFGESKKGGLRMWNKIVFERGGLAPHAGCNVIPFRSLARRFRTAPRGQMVAPCLEERACADHEECLPQAKTAVNQHFRPTSEAKSVLAEHFSVVKEHFSVVKKEILLLVPGKPTVFERNRTPKDHISLQMEQEGALRQGISVPAEAIFVSLLPKLLYRVDGEHDR